MLIGLKSCVYRNTELAQAVEVIMVQAKTEGEVCYIIFDDQGNQCVFFL